MRKNMLLFAAIITGTMSYAQIPTSVFGSPTIIWYGIDFTKAKMIGLDDSPHKIRDEYFKAWNAVIIDMDLAKVFNKNAAYKDVNGVNKSNLERETETLTTGAEVELTPEVIADVVSKLNPGAKKTGLGVVFIVESFNKTSETASVHVTFFDVANRKVLLTKKLTAKSGKGSANSAWSAAIKDILSQIEKKEFKAWKKEANY